MINQELVLNHETTQKELKSGNCKEGNEHLKTSQLASEINRNKEEGYREEKREGILSDENYEGVPRLLKDVERSKKFYLKWIQDLEEKKNEELEDVFLERTAEEEDMEEDEEVIQVVWYEGEEEETDPKKLIQMIEAVEGKKSNSKFTLSLVEEDEALESVDSEGESRGAFLEAKDSLEIIASTWSLNPRRQSVSSLDEPEQISSVWCEEEQMWVNFLHEELGKLTSADQHAVLDILEGGASGRLNIRDVASCLNSLVTRVPPTEADSDLSSDSLTTLEKPSKRVIFREATEMSTEEMIRVYERLKAISHISQKRVSFSHSPSELSHSQELYKSNKSLETAKSFETTKSKLSLEEKSSKKKVSFLDLVEEGNSEDNRSKTTKKVSFHHLISETDIPDTNFALCEQSSSETYHQSTSTDMFQDSNKNDITNFQVVIMDSNDHQSQVNCQTNLQQVPSNTCSLPSECLTHPDDPWSNFQLISSQTDPSTGDVANSADHRLLRQNRNPSTCSHRDVNLKAKSAHTFHRCVENDTTMMQNTHMHLEVGRSDDENITMEHVNTENNSYTYNYSELEGKSRLTVIGSTSHDIVDDNMAMLKEIIGEPYEFSKGDALSNQKMFDSNNQSRLQGKCPAMVDFSHSKPRHGRAEGLNSHSGFPEGTCSYTMAKSKDGPFKIPESIEHPEEITTNYDLATMTESNLTGNDCATTTYYTSISLIGSNQKLESSSVEDAVNIEKTLIPETDPQSAVAGHTNNDGSTPSVNEQTLNIQSVSGTDAQENVDCHTENNNPTSSDEDEGTSKIQSDSVGEHDSVEIIVREVSSNIVIQTRNPNKSLIEDSLTKQHSEIIDSSLSTAFLIPESQQLVHEPDSSIACKIESMTEDTIISSDEKCHDPKEVSDEVSPKSREAEFIFDQKLGNKEKLKKSQSKISDESRNEISHATESVRCQHDLIVVKTAEGTFSQERKHTKPKNDEDNDEQENSDRNQKPNLSNWLQNERYYEPKKNCKKKMVTKKDVDAVFDETRFLFRQTYEESKMKKKANQTNAKEESKEKCENSKENLSEESAELLGSSLISENSTFETISELVIQPGESQACLEQPDLMSSSELFKTEKKDESVTHALEKSHGDTVRMRKKKKKGKKASRNEPGCTEELISGDEYETADSDN